MARLRIGKVALRRMEPRVIVPFTDRTPLSTLRSGVNGGVALLEARVDLYRSTELSNVLSNVRKARTIAPVLATVRSGSQGGKWTQSETERLELYRALLPHVDAVDVELDAKIRGALVRAARKARRLVVLSHHDFRATPSASRLDALVQRSAKAGADVIKIATFVKSTNDVLLLSRLFVKHRNRPLVVIGMGPRGRVTRVLFPVIGSLFTFASLGRKTAPGQLSLRETLRGIEKCRALLR